MVQRLHLLDNLGDTVGVGEVGHDGDGVDLVLVPDLVGGVLQLLLVAADQDDVEAGLGEGQGVLLANTLNSQSCSLSVSQVSSNYQGGAGHHGPGSVSLLHPGLPHQPHQAGEEEGGEAPDEVVEEAGQEVEGEAEAEADENQLQVTVCVEK